ncbi:hypothetical protein APF79_12870 [bacterium BRH_c32]|nr:MAG: hypothetical protein APF79_12870 [bacterium BRH_c32]
MRKVILVILLIAPSIFAQSELIIQKEYADNLFNSGQLFDAISEYKRLQFFDTEGKYRFYSNMKIGEAYKGGGRFDDAVTYFANAERTAPNDSLFFDAAVNVIRTNILRRTNDNAHQLLDKLEKDLRFNDRMNEINYWRGWNYIFEDKWLIASLVFEKIEKNHPLALISKQTDKNKYSVNFAKVISYILPGFGQFYTGNYLSGLMSIGWVGLTGYWTINSFVEKRVFDGLVIGNLLFLRFYRGNYQNAEQFTIEKNIEVSNKSLINLQNNYQGIKP